MRNPRGEDDATTRAAEAGGRTDDGEARRSGTAPSAAEDADAGPDRTEPPDVDEEVYYCDLCGDVMLNLHCKLICERCGYKRDCSDP